MSDRTAPVDAASRGRSLSLPSASPGEGVGLYVLLCVFNLLNYIDRAAITGLVDPIRRDLNATDAQMGYVGSAFLLTYATLPIVFGWLGDRISRTSLIAASAAFWSMATAATALVRRIWQLVVMRAAVGVGEASYMATSPSLIMDLFTPPRRARAMSLFYTASPVGSAVGVAVGGFLWVHFGWRGACLLVGLPGLIAAGLMARKRDAVRGRFDSDVTRPTRRSILVVLVTLIHNRPYLCLTAAYGGMVFTQNAIEYWLPTVLQRDKAISIPTANAMYGTAVLVAGICGPLIGVAIADILRRRYQRAYFYVAASVAGLMALPLFGIAMAVGRVPLEIAVFGEAFFGNASIGIIITLVVGAVAAEMRSTATAISLTTVHLIGDIISIPLVGRISTGLQRAGPSSPVWVSLEVFGMHASQHLLVALVSVTICGAAATSTMFLIAARVERNAMRSTQDRFALPVASV